MLNPQEGYHQWSKIYDTDLNPTRDLEKKVAQQTLGHLQGLTILEIGCGTGKNTEWLAEKNTILAIDNSPEMLQIAQQKIKNPSVTFHQANLTQEWTFLQQKVDLIVCSLTLEHLQDLYFIYHQASQSVKNKGQFYLAEYHPFKQYLGKQACFKVEGETMKVESYVHHLSDYFNAAQKYHWTPLTIQEHFDENDRTTVPRLLTILFEKEGV